MQRVETVEEYIAALPEDVQPIMTSVRAAIRAAVPAAGESIHYGMPAYRFNTHPIAYFAAYKHHLGFFITPVGYGPFEQELSSFSRGKGSVKFPYQQEIPPDLIAEICRWRYQQALNTAAYDQ